MKEGNDESVPWDVGYIEDNRWFAERCVVHYQTNPHDSPVLERIIPHLVTELWDQGFSQTEIRTAFAAALSQLINYAGEEIRGVRRPRGRP